MFIKYSLNGLFRYLDAKYLDRRQLSVFFEVSNDKMIMINDILNDFYFLLNPPVLQAVPFPHDKIFY